MNIFIVDDNREFCTAIADILRVEGWTYEICNNPADAIEYIKMRHSTIGAMLLDIEFNHPTLNGMDVLEFTMKNFGQIPVIMISGAGTIETAVTATKLGAANFIAKSSISAEKLREVLYTALEKSHTKSLGADMQRILSECGLIGNSRLMQTVADQIMRFGKTELNILVSGETGTGKKLVAQAVHAVSKRSKQKFVTVDIPNIPATIFQSELFGHVKGAFTGTVDDKIGLFQQADKGTIFLDEIGDLAPELQANLLLPIEEKIVRRLGSVKEDKIDVRFVSATDKNLVVAMRDGKFREQLYHRLRECEIALPPLRERVEDIPPIVEYYVQKHNREFAEQKFLSASAFEFLQELPWRGNVRELANVLRVVLQTSPSDRVEVGDITIAAPNLSEHSVPQINTIEVLAESSGSTLREDVDTLNKLKILETLERCRGNVSKASAALGISRETLHQRIKKYAIDVDKFRQQQ